ncbi:MAG: hypothetical protein ACK5LM_06180 [Lactovum sp.]
MKSGYFLPLNNLFKLAWIWWVISLSFQQIIFFEFNMKWNFITISLAIVVVIYLAFLIRQRRFFISNSHLYITSDFKLDMTEFNCEQIMAVKLSRFKFSFIHAGKFHEFIIYGRSHSLLKRLLEENKIEYINYKEKASN